VSDEGWEQRLARLGSEPLDGGLTLHIARAYSERRRGLAKMAPLPGDHALRILKCNSVHTFGMRFPLDLVWLGRRVKLCVCARSVVETCAGQGDRFAQALSDDA
jgi:hypothetical protein